ncbi:hypothetical protein [Risungbinella massiliensis]|nr:hypothetical protein [Risungbinella massiliensis]
MCRKHWLKKKKDDNKKVIFVCKKIELDKHDKKKKDKKRLCW